MNATTVDRPALKMEYSIESVLLLSYAIPKFKRPRYARTLKAVLPRKKSSPRRIGVNLHWNLLEEACKITCYDFKNLNFNNEINDNTVNEARDRIMKINVIHQTRKSETYYNTGLYTSQHMEFLHFGIGPASDQLTPPLTPQIGHGGFQFSSKENTINLTSEFEVEGMPLTPCDLDVFSY